MRILLAIILLLIAQHANAGKITTEVERSGETYTVTGDIRPLTNAPVYSTKIPFGFYWAEVPPARLVPSTDPNDLPEMAQPYPLPPDYFQRAQPPVPMTPYLARSARGADVAYAA